MRITMNELNRHMQYVITKKYSDLASLQEQLSTGRRLLRPSDDPVDVANDLKLRTKLKELAQYKRNIDDGLAWMGVSGTAMDSMNTLLQRLRELAVQGATDTVGSNERMYINKETEQLFRQLVALVNTQFKGDYVFAGTQTRTPPVVVETSRGTTTDDYTQLKMSYFNAAGLPVGSSTQLFNGFDDSAVTNIIPGSFKLSVAGTRYAENVDYSIDYEAGTITILNAALAQDVTPGSANYAAGAFSIEFDYLTGGKDIYGDPVTNNGEIQRAIESGIVMPVNIGLDELTIDPATGMDMMGVVVRFGQSLVKNNQAGIEAAISEIDSVFSAVLSVQSKNGARINRFETTLSRNEGQTTETTALQAELEDAEMAETVMKFTVAQNVYNAALSSAAKVIQPSLVNFL